MCCFMCGSVLVLRFRDGWSYVSCDISMRVTSVLWFLRGRRSGRARFVRKNRQNALVPDGCSCGTGNQAQLTIVALVNPVAQETRTAKPPSRQHKVDSQADFGFPWDPRGITGVQETVVRGDQAVVGCSRKTQSMGSCDVHVLPETFNRIMQRVRISHTKNKLIRTSSPWSVKKTTFRTPGHFFQKVVLILCFRKEKRKKKKGKKKGKKGKRIKDEKKKEEKKKEKKNYFLRTCYNKSCSK